MSNRLTLAEKIVAAVFTGKVPAELSALDSIVDGSTIASGTPAAAIEAAEENHTINETFDDAEVKAALDALGAAINDIRAVLAAFKQTA